MKMMITRTAIAVALSFGMIGFAQAQDTKRADPAKVKQVQRALNKKPEVRADIFKSLEAQDERSLRRALKMSGLERQFETPAEIGGVLCLIDGIPWPQFVCNKLVSEMYEFERIYW